MCQQTFGQVGSQDIWHQTYILWYVVFVVISIWYLPTDFWTGWDLSVFPRLLVRFLYLCIISWLFTKRESDMRAKCRIWRKVTDWYVIFVVIVMVFAIGHYDIRTVRELRSLPSGVWRSVLQRSDWMMMISQPASKMEPLARSIFTIRRQWLDCLSVCRLGWSRFWLVHRSGGWPS